jgi:hypothetical protein
MVLDDWRRDGASSIPSGHKPFSGWGHQKRKGVKDIKDIIVHGSLFNVHHLSLT